MTEQEIREYNEFMRDPENSHNCEECPENRGEDSYQNRKPCGQWNCWVDCHCKER